MILVTVILLPLRVAVIAAVAIPVTICTSLGVLNAIGVQLHQVSIAALIMVLGIVVDDAIVIADNYVDCLDRGIATERGSLAMRARGAGPGAHGDPDDHRFVSAAADSHRLGRGVHQRPAHDRRGGALVSFWWPFC